MPPALSGPLPPSIPDSQLGLSASELAILRQHQQIALASSSSTSHTTANSVSTRGRGHVRGSASTSRAASAASSNVGGGGGRLLLDAGSLAVLGRHFEGLMGAIGGRIDSVSERTWLSYLRLFPCSLRSPITAPLNLHPSLVSQI